MSFAMTEFASRPVQTGSAVRISLALLAMVAGLAAGKALIARVATPALAEPAPAVATLRAAPAKDVCRAVEVEIDEGYGVRGHVTRWVCRKAG
ncbi:hypothetical protein CQW49_06385 [Methylosinus trichosporium OB3b]|uniref:Uncharacterized protein n=2 Tax=Methylocystaceae TaxID=31993 RepID=A0A2D2CXW6_METT3|nr:hypothetical protein CQW49_06385 [Methylosinus trichosporium OB3b]OBS50791.1 hypothetical protein A8B73_19710 [Methylosinus sp. 3S-1]